MKLLFRQPTVEPIFRKSSKTWRTNSRVCFLSNLSIVHCLLTNFPILANLAQPQALTTRAPLGVANERVRKSPPLTTSEETSVIIKRPKIDTAGSRGRTRISDFDDLTKSLLEETISIYQAQIIAVQPWPSTSENWEYISQAWIEVCSSRKVQIDLDDEIYKFVRTSLIFYFFFP
jgi:hypothetical protein